MPSLRSLTYLHAAQANAQTKAFKRVCLPNRTRTVQTRHDRPLPERRAATNTGLAKVAVQCSAVRQLAEVSHPLASGLRINPLASGW